MKKFIILFLFSQVICAKEAEFQWALQITDHNFELSHYDLSDEDFKPYLKKTSWRCFVGKVTQRAHLMTRELRCDYSIKKTGAVATKLSCSSNIPYNDLTLHLYDQVKNLELKIMLSCKKKN